MSEYLGKVGEDRRSGEKRREEEGGSLFKEKEREGGREKKE